MALDIRNLKNKVTANDDITDVAESVVTGIAGVTSAAAGLKAYIPALICTLIAAFVSFFFKQETLDSLKALVGENETPVWIGYLIFLFVMFVFFFDVSFPIATGIALSMMTRMVTGSDIGAFLAGMTGVLLTIGFSPRLRKTMAIVVYSIVVFFSLFIAWSLMSSSQTEKGVELDGYNTIMKIVLPIGIFMIAALVVKLFIAKDFRLLDGLMKNGKKVKVPYHMAAAVIPAAIVGFMYRSTWAKGIFVLTRDFYSSKLLFWTIHIPLILVIFKIYDELVNKEMIRPINLLKILAKLLGLGWILFSLFLELLRRCRIW